jgi:hypothetical protein
MERERVAHRRHGHALNERADELAREGLIAARAGAIGAMKTK